MPVDEDLLLVIKSSTLGSEPDLGEKLLSAFLTQLLEVGHLPQRIICLSSAVFLTTRGSPVLALMQRLAAAGCRVQSCGTCLDYYERRDRLEVGEVGNMRETVEAMLAYRRVIQL